MTYGQNPPGTPQGQRMYENVYKKSFVDRLRDGVALGNIPNLTKQARNWYREKAANDISAQGERIGASPNRIIGGAPVQNMRTGVRPGNMYLYCYDPKYAATLPLYDIFPCTIIFRMYPDGYLGLNLHYLPFMQRAYLMDALYPFVSDHKYDEKTQYTFTYPILKMMGGRIGFERCLKRYLYRQVRSRFLYVHPNEWDIAAFLPLERFSDQNTKQTQHQAGVGGLRRGTFR